MVNDEKGSRISDNIRCVRTCTLILSIKQIMFKVTISEKYLTKKKSIEKRKFDADVSFSITKQTLADTSNEV